MAQSILHQLVWVLSPQSLLQFCSFPCDEKYIICHKLLFFFIKRGQPSISPAITHAITLIILLCLICVILDKNVQTPSGIYFTVTSASLYTFDSILLKPRQQYSVRAIVTDNWHWISQNFKQNAFSRLFFSFILYIFTGWTMRFLFKQSWGVVENLVLSNKAET